MILKTQSRSRPTPSAQYESPFYDKNWAASNQPLYLFTLANFSSMDRGNEGVSKWISESMGGYLQVTLSTLITVPLTRVFCRWTHAHCPGQHMMKLLLQLPAGDVQRCHPSCRYNLEPDNFDILNRRRKTPRKQWRDVDMSDFISGRG